MIITSDILDLNDLSFDLKNNILGYYIYDEGDFYEENKRIICFVCIESKTSLVESLISDFYYKKIIENKRFDLDIDFEISNSFELVDKTILDIVVFNK